MDDALRAAPHPSPDAAYAAALASPELDERERDLAARMIGRPLRSRSAAVVRCGWGLPAVLRVDPRLDSGTPFPTMFWLACPLAVKHVGRLEAEGAMIGLNERLAADPAFAARYGEAHERYLAARAALGPVLPRADDSAGGMPTRVKCLHALYGHQLATGDNPVGAWVADQIEPMACPAPCVSEQPA